MGIAEVLLFAVVVSIGLPLALVAIQLLWLNVVTNGIQHMALTFEKGDPQAMLRPPRDPAEGVFDGRMRSQTLVAALTVGSVASVTWMFLVWNTELSVPAARNLLLLLMVLFENVHVLNCRSEYRSILQVPFFSNPYLIGAILLAQGLHITALYVPFLRRLLGTSPVSLLEWIYLFLLSFSVIITVEVYKAIVRKRFGERKVTGESASL
jgi:magnesium-transporting ATPase (P-type)